VSARGRHCAGDPRNSEQGLQTDRFVADTGGVSDLIETRWTRYGKDRVYVAAADGAKVGFVDLVAGTMDVLAPGYDDVMQGCLQRWLAPTSPAGVIENPDLLTVPSPADIAAVTEVVAVSDLAGNQAGAAARAKRDEVNAKAPVLNLFARVLGVKTEERSWRVGAKGEEKIAHELNKLGAEWRVLHAVEVGVRGSDIDHVVIGPPGVITLNTKRHPDGKVWVGERSVMVNGFRTDYLRNSRHEASRASRLLTSAHGHTVEVIAAIVFVDLVDFVVKQMPTDLYVTTKRKLLRWLESMPATMSTDQVESVFTIARRATTWRPPSV
jgi:Nuclease-related domain